MDSSRVQTILSSDVWDDVGPSRQVGDQHPDAVTSNATKTATQRNGLDAGQYDSYALAYFFSMAHFVLSWKLEALCRVWWGTFPDKNMFYKQSS